MARLIRSALVFVSLLLASCAVRAEPVTAFIGWAITAIGTYATAISVAITVVSIASAAYQSSQQKKAARASAARKLQEDIANLQARMQTIVSSEAPWTVVYGQPGPIGGVVAGMLTGGGAQHLNHVFILLASHECAGVDEIYIGGVPVGLATLAGGWSTNPEFAVPGLLPSYPATNDGVHVDIHTSPGGVDTADAWVMGAIAGTPAAGMWTADHKFSGFTYAVVTFNIFLEKFQGGMQEVTARIRGKPVYDPRTGLTAYSRNPALCLNDFLRSEAGYGASAAQVDENALIAAANACDQAIFPPSSDVASYGGSLARYTCDGMFRTDQDRESVRQQIEDSMAGFSLESGGVWRMQAGAWSTPVMALTNDDLLAPVKVLQTCNPGIHRYNGAKGMYINASRAGVTEDFTPYQNATFRSLDAKDKWLDIALTFTGSHVRAHQIARVKVEQSRGGFVVQISPKMSAWHLQPGDRITLSDGLYAFTNKTFRVSDWGYQQGAPLTLQCVEDVSTYYDLIDEVLADAAPNTNLPNPFLAPPIPGGLSVESGDQHVLQQGGSLIVRALVAWNAATAQSVVMGGAVRLQWRLLETTQAWQTVDLPGGDSRYYLANLSVGGTYQVRARFQTAYAVSEWANVTHVIVGRAQPPAQVDGFHLTVEHNGIHARWDTPPGLDMLGWSTTRLRVGVSWASGYDVFNGKALFTNIGWFPVGALRVWASHGNTVGVFSTPVAAEMVITQPLQPVVDGEVIGSRVDLVWTACTATQPIAHYNIYLGNIFSTALIVGSVNALNFSRNELQAGTWLYWVVAVDMAGNVGVPGYKELTTLPSIQEALEELQEGLDDVVADIVSIGADLGAEALARETLAATVGEVSAAITEESIIRSTETANLYARWGVKIVSGNKVAGIILNNDGSESSFVALADKFGFVMPDGSGGVKYPFTIGDVAGTATVGIDGNAMIDGTVKARHLEAETITADKLAANSVTVEKIAAGAITADKMNVGSGANLLPNSVWLDKSVISATDKRPTGWTAAVSLGGNTFEYYATPEYHPTWVPYGMNGIDMHHTSAWGTPGYMLLQANFPVLSGRRYECSVYSGAHRASITVDIQWFNGSGASLGSSRDLPISNNNEVWGGTSLGAFKRIGCFGTAPAGAALGQMRIIKIATGADSHAFLVAPMAAEATVSQTIYSSYSQAGLGVQITPAGISTPSLEAVSGVMGNLYSGSVRGGSFTGYSWPASGGGYYLGPSGLLMGNLNTGSYAQIDAAGNFYAPGMTIINGTMTISQINVVGTTNIAAGAASSAAWASGTGSASVGISVPSGQTHRVLLTAFFPSGIYQANSRTYSLNGLSTVTVAGQFVTTGTDGGEGANGGATEIYYAARTMVSMVDLGAGSYTMTASTSMASLAGIYLVANINRRP